MNDTLAGTVKLDLADEPNVSARDLFQLELPGEVDRLLGLGAGDGSGKGAIYWRPAEETLGPNCPT